MINPFDQGNIFRNCVYVLCKSIHPGLIDYRRHLPENFYEKSNTTLIEMRRASQTNFSSESLIPIPGIQFYSQILKRHENGNEIFKEELNVFERIFFFFRSHQLYFN